MTGQTGETKTLFQRLPQTVVPTHYDVTIQPYLDQFKFNGNVNIHLKVRRRSFLLERERDRIVLLFRLKNQRIVSCSTRRN